MRIRNAPRSNKDPVERVQYSSDQPSMTKQSFMDECDVNLLVKRSEQGQHTRHINPNTPIYGDFSNVDDYSAALSKMRLAETAFDNLPKQIRDRFDHDPGQLLDFMDDKENVDEARQLGLLPAAPAESTTVPTEPAPEIPVPGITPKPASEPESV